MCYTNISMKNKELYIICILAILLFLVTLIGTSYAFFSYKIKGNEEATPIIIKTSEIYVKLNQTNEISVNNIYPNWNDSLSFSIHNVTEEENVPATYEIKWIITTNTFDSEDLVFNLKGKVIENNKEISESKYNKLVSIPQNTKVPNISTSIGTGLVNSNCIHEYELTINVNETGTNQNNLQNKILNGQIIVK